LNIAYRYPISSLSSETIEYIEKEIIGYWFLIPIL
jgi:hypothetical protein